MMNSEKKNHNDHLPENIELAEDVGVIMAAPENLDKIAKPPTLKQWIGFIKDYLPPQKQIPGEESIKEIMDEIALLENPEIFEDNAMCCYTIIPCSPSGKDWSVQELMSNSQIVRIIIAPENKKIPEQYLRQQKLLRDFMPAEIRETCGFKISHYNNGKKISSERLKIRLLTETARSLLNLQRLLSGS